MIGDKDSPLIRWLDASEKDRGAARAGLDRMGGQHTIRTTFLADGDELRTHGGFPAVRSDERRKKWPIRKYGAMHGMIVNDKLYLYDDHTNKPTGRVINLDDTADGWQGAYGQHYRHGHTQYVRGMSLNQNSTAPWSAVASAKPAGSSLLYGLQQLHTVKEMIFSFNGNGVNAWLYQAPSGDKHILRLTFTVPYMGYPSGYRREANESWTVTTGLIAQKINTDGTLGDNVTVFSEVTFTVENITGMRLEWDNYVRDGSNYVPEHFEGVNVSPTGNEAILNWLVFQNPPNSSIRNHFCAKTMRLTITESEGTLSASWAVDLSESECYLFTQGHDNSSLTLAYRLHLDTQTQYLFDPYAHYITTYTYVPGDSSDQQYASTETIDIVYDELKCLLVRGFEPSAETNTVTGLWYKKAGGRQGTHSTSHSSSGELIEELIFDAYGSYTTTYTGTLFYTVNSSIDDFTYTLKSILKDNTVAVEYREETRKSGDYLNVSAHTGYTRTVRIVEPATYFEKISVCNGVKIVEGGMQSPAYDETKETSLDPESFTQDPVYYGTFRTVGFGGVFLETNNCAYIRIDGSTFVSDFPSGSVDPIADGFQRVLSAALGTLGSKPAAHRFSWKMLWNNVADSNNYREFIPSVSWNPRRQMLWGIVLTETRPSAVPTYTPTQQRVSWI